MYKTRKKSKTEHLEVINIAHVLIRLRRFSLCRVKYLSTHLGCCPLRRLPKPITGWVEGEIKLVSSVCSFSPSVPPLRPPTPTTPHDFDLHWIMTSDNLISLLVQQNGEASLFEVNIRYVGGLLSAYYLTGEEVRLIDVCYPSALVRSGASLYFPPARPFEWWTARVSVTAVCLCVETCHRTAPTWNYLITLWVFSCFRTHTHHVVFKLGHGARCCSVAYSDKDVRFKLP